MCTTATTMSPPGRPAMVTHMHVPLVVTRRRPHRLAWTIPRPRAASLTENGCVSFASTSCCTASLRSWHVPVETARRSLRSGRRPSLASKRILTITTDIIRDLHLSLLLLRDTTIAIIAASVETRSTTRTANVHPRLRPAYRQRPRSPTWLRYFPR